MIEFEVRSDRQKEMIKVLNGLVSQLADSDTPPPMDQLMGLAMKAGVGNYMDLILGATGAMLPVKVDVMRQFFMYGKEAPGEDAGVPKYVARKQPVKYALTAMGLAAIASGKGGKELIMQKYLPEIAKGRLFCYCITEPNAGTNTNKISTVAIDEGDHFRLNGQKTFISAADTAHYMVVIAKVEKPGEEGSVGTFIMETKTPGISMTELDMAVLGDNQYTIHYDDVILPKEALVGSKQATKGRRISNSVFATLNLERIIVGFSTIRICQEAIVKATKRALEKPMLGQAPGVGAGVKQKLARVQLKFELANLAIKKATEAYDAGLEPQRIGMFANMAKLRSTEAANEACSLALSLHGVAGLDQDDANIGALYQMARLLKVAPINNEMILNFLGEHLLGLPKSYR